MRNGSDGKIRTKKPEPSPVIAGSANVFADLGLPDADLALAKARLAQAIREAIAARRMTQAAAAELMGIDQPKVSALVRGRVANYTLDRLVRLAARLGHRVEIVVAPRTRPRKAAAV